MEKQEKTPQEKGMAIVSQVVANNTKTVAGNIIEGIKEGNINPAMMGIILKKFEKISKLVSEDAEAKETIQRETIKHKEKAATFYYGGAKLQLANHGYWDYSTTEDPLLEKLKEIAETVKLQIKAREAELQSKSEAWEKRNTPTNGGIDFKVSAFSVTWDALPELTWDEAFGELETMPPIKRGRDILKYFV